MRIFLRYIFVVIGLAAIPRPAEARELIHKGDTVVVPLRGEISPPLLLFLRRAVKTAESAGAGAIVFEMDTYGGRLDAASEITSVLNHATIPTYMFINSNAGSAGSLIALATQHIYMSPVSAIGAAAPVLSTGEDLPATERDKTISYWSALIRSSALRNGHNPDLGEAFMTKEKEVKIGDRVVHPKGSLLTLTAQEATEKINGKPLLADGIADSVEDLARKAGLKGKLVSLDPSGFERLAFWITKLAPLLLLLGIICAYLEFKIPGASLPGIIAAFCFALFFLGHYLAGLAGWEVVAPFRARRCPRPHRGPVFRPLDNCLRRSRRIPHARLAALGDDRSLSRRNIFPDRPDDRNSDAQSRSSRSSLRRSRSSSSRAISRARAFTAGSHS